MSSRGGNRESYQKLISPFDLENLESVQKNIVHDIAIIKLLEPAFIHTSLQILYDFIREENEAITVFRNANFEQSIFLQSVISMCKIKELHDILINESKCLLRKIATLLSSQQNFELEISVGEMDTTTKLRTVSLKKSRIDDIKDEIKSGVLRNASPKSKPDKYNTQILDNSTESNREEKDPSKNSTTNHKIEIRTEETINKQRKPNSQMDRYIQNQMRAYKDSLNPDATVDAKTIEEKAKSTVEKTISHAKGTTIDPTIANKAINNQNQAKVEKGAGGSLGLRKSRLIEGLSTPLESDVAMRMMRQMGWEGGPLGARGDGLLEPVMPAIHLKAGAGLGHVGPKKEPKPQPPKMVQKEPKPQPPKIVQKEPKPQPPKIVQNPPQTLDQPSKPKLSITVYCHKTSDVRLDILRQILNLITERPDQRIVIYSSKLVKKEIKFFENTMNVITKRGVLNFGDGYLKDIYEKIAAEMSSKPELQIGCTMANDNNSVVLKKNVVPQTLKTVKNQELIDRVTSIAADYTLSELITPEMTAILGQQLMPQISAKSARSLGHRVIIITTVLALIHSDDMERIIKFDYPMSCKQLTYLRDMLSSLNKRKQWAHSTVFERHLSKKTLALVKDDTYLTALFGKNNQQITFQKTPVTKYLERQTIAHDPKNNNNVVSNKTNKPNENDKYDSVAKTNDKDNAKKDSKIVNVNNNVIENEIIDLTEDEHDKSDEKEKNTKKVKKIHIEEVKTVSLDDNKEISDTKEGDNKKSDKELAKTNDELTLGLDIESQENIDEKNVNIKYLGVAPITYPIKQIEVDQVIAFQKCISELFMAYKTYNIKPLLECLGIKNDTLVYCCHNVSGAFFINLVANKMRLQTIDITDLFKNNPKVYKMKADVNSYIEINLNDLFNEIELYNEGLKTNLWIVEDMKANAGKVTILLQIDEHSFEYIFKRKFKIFAGMDVLKFNMSWDE